jgi:hypothetical protein
MRRKLIVLLLFLLLIGCSSVKRDTDCAKRDKKFFPENNGSWITCLKIQSDPSFFAVDDESESIFVIKLDELPTEKRRLNRNEYEYFGGYSLTYPELCAAGSDGNLIITPLNLDVAEVSGVVDIVGKRCWPTASFEKLRVQFKEVKN